MLLPKKLKHRKVRKNSYAGPATRGYTVSFGQFALKAMDRGWLTSRQIEAGRRAMTRYIKRGGKIWTRVFPDKPITQKPLEVGMGGGHGALDHFVAVIRPGTIIYEIGGIDRTVAQEAMRLAANKLPFKTKFISQEEEL